MLNFGSLNLDYEQVRIFAFCVALALLMTHIHLIYFSSYGMALVT
jgi:hypothetical protein